jgi:alkylation response protein AidB-like acyl-CoA dehydrogenase
MAAAHPIPAPAFDNLFAADPLAEAFWSHWLGAATWPALRPHFVELGRRGAEAQPLSALADRESPRLEAYDARGERVDRVVYHPAYRQLESLAYGGGIVALKYEADFLAAHRTRRHLAGFGAGYYFAQTELGLYCPVCMTDGVGRVLEAHADLPPARETLARLASRDPARLWQGSMYLTERQGGSDVGANEAQARQVDGQWRLSGDKWFCSNVDAEAMLVLARLPDGPPGTRGLGLFLLLRHTPDDNAATIRINRLKDKLGVRSMATGEVSLLESRATLLAGVNEGFKAMAEMINLSRLYNAVASLAAMRRALLEALAYGSQRRAFGQPLWNLPLWRAGMADLMAEQLGLFTLVFETVRALDRADGGDPAARSLVRLLTPLVKAISGKAALFAVSEAMEAIGGNAYIEESILPRLLRDCQVLPIWEGTTNILVLDALRAIEKERAAEAFFDRAQAGLAAARANPALPSRAATQAEAHLRLVREQLAALESLAPEDRQRAGRQWLESAGRAMTRVLLLEAAGGSGLATPCLAAFTRLDARPSPTAPLAGSDAVRLAVTEEPLLRAGYAGPRGQAHSPVATLPEFR